MLSLALGRCRLLTDVHRLSGDSVSLGGIGSPLGSRSEIPLNALEEVTGKGGVWVVGEIVLPRPHPQRGGDVLELGEAPDWRPGCLAAIHGLQIFHIPVLSAMNVAQWVGCQGRCVETSMSEIISPPFLRDHPTLCVYLLVLCLISTHTSCALYHKAGNRTSIQVQ